MSPNQLARFKPILSLIDRGDTNAPDFDTTYFTRDSAWHELDLSGQIPAEAKFIYFSLYLVNTIVTQARARLRPHGNTNAYNVVEFWASRTNSNFSISGLVALSPDCKIDYNIHSSFTTVELTVCSYVI